MKPAWQITCLRRVMGLTLLGLAAMCPSSGANAAITFTPGHIYGTWDFTVTGPLSVIEYTETGTFWA